ncbi:MAG: putative membrane protein [Cenarchaeum symbiont of Oopsacas minuta]|nr:putative membrane protein [Cenarchaeum symbiont of Oopsacas minuta]
MSTYKAKYSPSESMNFIIPIIALAFLGIVYIMSQRAGSEFVSFILIAAATLPTIYWVFVIKKMTIKNATSYAPREQDTKNWVYDLIQGEKEFVFVAEVPGPEDKITVRVIDGILYIRGSSNFSKEIPMEHLGELSDFKYKNGVLTLRIKRS